MRLVFHNNPVATDTHRTANATTDSQTRTVIRDAALLPAARLGYTCENNVYSPVPPPPTVFMGT